MPTNKRPGNGFRWTARVLGALVLLFVIAETIEESKRGPVPAEDKIFFVGWGLMLLGLVVAYFRDGLGGAVTIAGFLYHLVVVNTHDASGQPPIGLVAFLPFIGVLYVIAWGLREVGSRPYKTPPG